MTQHNLGLEDAAASTKPGVTSVCGEAIDAPTNSRPEPKNQAPSRAVQASIERNHARLLSIKSESLWRIYDNAAGRIEEAMRALEDRDDDAILEHGSLFLEAGSSISKLLKDFRETREAIQ
jgi:hypothetical protein